MAPKPIPARAPEAGLIGWREIRTVLDKGTQVNGKLSFTAPTRIEGRLRGEVRAADRDVFRHRQMQQRHGRRKDDLPLPDQDRRRQE